MDVDQEFLYFHEHLDISDKRKMASKLFWSCISAADPETPVAGWASEFVSKRIPSTQASSAKLMGRRATILSL